MDLAVAGAKSRSSRRNNHLRLGCHKSNVVPGRFTMSALYTKSSTNSDRRLALRALTSSFVLAAGFALVAASPGVAGDVVTYHNDNARTGQYLQETILNPSNVRSSTFGKLFTFPVDSVIDAQLL